MGANNMNQWREEAVEAAIQAVNTYCNNQEARNEEIEKLCNEILKGGLVDGPSMEELKTAIESMDKTMKNIKEKMTMLRQVFKKAADIMGVVVNNTQKNLGDALDKMKGSAMKVKQVANR